MTPQQLEREIRNIKRKLCCLDDIVTFNNSLNNSSSAQTVFYKAPDSFLSLENGLVLNGAMSTATLTTVGPYDNIDVGLTGNIQDNNIHFNGTQYSAHEKVVHVRLKINSVDGIDSTAGLWHVDVPSSIYSSSTSANFYSYVDLSTGVITSTPGAGSAVVEDNQWTGGVSAGQIVDIYLFMKYAKYFRTVFIKQGNLQEISYSDITFTEGGADGDYRQHNPHSTMALSLTNLDCTVLDVEVYSDNANNLKIAFVGDSISAGHYIPAEDMILEIMRTKIPYNVQTFAGRGERLKGMLACIHEWLPSRPQYVVLEPWQTAMRDSDSNPLDAGYAAFQLDFARAIAAIKSIGAIPILPQCESLGIPYFITPTQAGYYKTFLETYYPNERTFTILESESFYDSSTLHYTSITNAIYCDKVLAIIEADGNL